MSDTECPYCGCDVEINHDDGYGYEEDETHQQECGECGKTFVFTTTIHFTYDTSKADCLNGSVHSFRERKRYGITTTPQTILVCNDCGYEQRPNAEMRGASRLHGEASLSIDGLGTGDNKSGT